MTHDCPHGRIESSWSRRRDRIDLVVTVPPGTVADIHLPDGNHIEQGPGTLSHSWSDGR